MEYVTDNKVTSDFAKRLDDAVEAIKRGEGWRIEYMQLKEKMDKQYNAGHEAGVEEGIIQGIERGIEQGIERGVEQGIEKTIQTYITKSVEAGKSREDVISELGKLFGYSKADAQRLYTKYAV